MAKRKASTTLARDEPAASSSSPLTPQDVAQINKEHREYLLATIGIRPEDEDEIVPSPAKKRKMSARKPTSSSEESESAKTLRNAAKSKSKPKASGRNDSALESAGDDTGAKGTGDVEIETAAKPKKTGKAKTASRREGDGDSKAQRTGLTEIETAVKPQKSKKSKAASQRKPAVSEAAVDDPDTPTTSPETPKPKPKPKLKLKTTAPQSKSSKTQTDTRKSLSAAETPPVATPRKPVPPALAAKVRQISHFVDTIPETDSRLSRDAESLLHVPERNLRGALVSLRTDFELPRPLDDGEFDFGDVVHARYTAPVYGTEGIAAAQPWVVLKPEAGVLEMEIQEKISGCGLEDVDLLEVELEMLQREHRKKYGLECEGMGRVSDLGKLRKDVKEAIARIEERIAADARALEGGGDEGE